MMKLCIRSDANPKTKLFKVESFADASKAVSTWIDAHGLGAGCANTGWSFHLATLATESGQPVATVSYNGRVWSCKDGKEISCAS